MTERILEMLENIRPESNFRNSTDFIADTLLDSVDIMELVAMLENTFSVEISNMDIVPENFTSVYTLSVLVEKSRIRNK
jgi:acyl carrier protein